MSEKKVIYYWASNQFNNNGEGVLANNFLNLLKVNFKKYKLMPINNFTHIDQNTFFYRYILTIWGALTLWKYYILGKKYLI